MAAKKKAKKAKAKAKPKAKKVKKTKKKVAKPKVKKEKQLGIVEHVFDKINVAAIKLKAPIKVGDVIHIKGHTTDYEMPITSIQIDHVSVMKAKKGDDIGIKITQHTREHDGVFLKKL
jgi:hypothetical protein